VPCYTLMQHLDPAAECGCAGVLLRDVPHHPRALCAPPAQGE
jgi:hypothetical protein